MNIGIDVDGVLNDLEGYQQKYTKKYFKNKYKYDNSFYHIEDALNCSEKIARKFWIRYIWKYCISEPPRADAKNIIKKLREEGNKIYIITGRVFVMKQNFLGALFRFMLFNWLKRNSIEYDDIALCSDVHSTRDKLIECKKFKIDIMLEDRADNIMGISSIAKLICFDAGYNKNCSGESIYRVTNFKEAYKIIQKL